MEGGVDDGFSRDVPRTVTPGAAVGVARRPRWRMWDSSRADNSLNEVRRGLLFLGTQSRVVCGCGCRIRPWQAASNTLLSLCESRRRRCFLPRFESSRACALAASFLAVFGSGFIFSHTSLYERDFFSFYACFSAPFTFCLLACFALRFTVPLTARSDVSPAVENFVHRARPLSTKRRWSLPRRVKNPN